MEEKDLQRLEAELARARTRYEEAKRTPKKIEAEKLLTRRDLKRKRDLLVVKQGMLGDCEKEMSPRRLS